MDQKTFNDHNLGMKRNEYNEKIYLTIFMGIVIFLTIVIYNIYTFVDKFIGNNRSDADNLTTVFGSFLLSCAIILLAPIVFCCVHLFRKMRSPEQKLEQHNDQHLDVYQNNIDSVYAFYSYIYCKFLECLIKSY